MQVTVIVKVDTKPIKLNRSQRMLSYTHNGVHLNIHQGTLNYTYYEGNLSRHTTLVIYIYTEDVRVNI